MDNRVWGTNPKLPLSPGGVGYTSLVRVRLHGGKEAKPMEKRQKGLKNLKQFGKKSFKDVMP